MILRPLSETARSSASKMGYFLRAQFLTASLIKYRAITKQRTLPSIEPSIELDTPRNRPITHPNDSLHTYPTPIVNGADGISTTIVNPYAIINMHRPKKGRSFICFKRKDRMSDTRINRFSAGERMWSMMRIMAIIATLVKSIRLSIFLVRAVVIGIVQFVCDSRERIPVGKVTPEVTVCPPSSSVDDASRRDKYSLSSYSSKSL
mmetsp:Transcript_33316/g.49649  ORF Transcript_33316/g.49649 Transcript_33316/m.49649 type:complete len:205 (+) Transcript_33316:1170-1784(+)